MKYCPHCHTVELTLLNELGSTALACPSCHGLWLPKPELEHISRELPLRGWFDVALWEKKELLTASLSEMVCPNDASPMVSIKWNEEVEAYMCKECGGLWLPASEYKKIPAAIADQADSEVMEGGGELFLNQLAMFLEGKKGAKDEFSALKDLMMFLEYRFAAKHPALTELIEGLPFAS